MELHEVDVVLVRPARPANVAAACRAMKNMGLRSLVTVGATPGLDDPGARAAAYGAWDVLDGRRAADTLRDAVAGCTVVAGTSGRASPGDWSPRALAEHAMGRAGRLALVFGPEASGLTNQELATCHLRVHVPTDPAHPSLNLAQAVLLLSYELRLAAMAGPPAVSPVAPAATAGELEDALEDLSRALLAIGYLSPTNPHAILAELRGLFVRAGPTAREVALLRGLARQIAWAGSHLPDPTRRDG